MWRRLLHPDSLACGFGGGGEGWNGFGCLDSRPLCLAVEQPWFPMAAPWSGATRHLWTPGPWGPWWHFPVGMDTSPSGKPLAWRSLQSSRYRGGEESFLHFLKMCPIGIYTRPNFVLKDNLILKLTAIWDFTHFYILLLIYLTVLIIWKAFNENISYFVCVFSDAFTFKFKQLISCHTFGFGETLQTTKKQNLCMTLQLLHSNR